MKLRKLTTGNYFGYYNGYSIFIYKRFHGKWCCLIRLGSKAIACEGYHTKSLPTMNKVKAWVKSKV